MQVLEVAQIDLLMRKILIKLDFFFLQRLDKSDDRTIDILDIEYDSDDVSPRDSVDIDTGIQRRIGKHKRFPITCHWIVTFFVSYS